MGIYSNLVSLSALTEKGVKLRLPAGRQRTIKIYGVATYLESCEGKAASELFSNSLVPEIYTLAASDPVDVLTDAKVDVKQTVPTGSETNLLNSCFKENAKPIPPSDVKAVRVLATYGSGSPIVDSVDLSLSDGQLSLAQSMPGYVGIVPQLAVSPDNQRVMVWSPDDGYHQQFSYEYPGALVPKTDGIVHNHFPSKTGLFFSPDSQFAIMTGSFFTFLKAALPQYEVNDPNQFGASGPDQAFVRDGKVYFIRSLNGVLDVGYGDFPALGAWDTPLPVFPTGISIANGIASSRSVITESYFHLLYTATSGALVRTASFTDHGALTPVGETLLGPYSIALVQIAYAPVQNKMVVLTGGGPSSVISVYDMNPNGSMGTSVTWSSVVPHSFRLLMDPSSRYFIVATENGGVSNLLSFLLLDDGKAEPKDSLTLGSGMYNIATLVPL